MKGYIVGKNSYCETPVYAMDNVVYLDGEEAMKSACYDCVRELANNFDEIEDFGMEDFHIGITFKDGTTTDWDIVELEIPLY